MSEFERLLAARPVLTDGAWGTELQKNGLRPGECADLWNLTRPDAVEAVARTYADAGSQVVLTNTFRANPVALAAAGAADRIEAINRAGVVLSRRGAAGRARVFASIGPTGKLVSAEEISPGEALAAFEAQVKALAEEGPDALLCETFSDVEEARLAARAALATGLPVILSFAFDSGKRRDRTMTGATPEQAAKAMAEEGVHVVGANCGAGPEAFAEVCRRLGEASGLPVWIKPNAGMPVVENGQILYTMTPEAFAGYLPALIEAGASFVGGCCGTSPPFIAALARSRPA